MMTADNVRRLRLATRDGYITETVWRRLGLPGQVSIFHTSRRLTLMPALVTGFEIEVASFLTSSTTITLRDCIERLNLPDDAELLETLAKITSIDRPIDGPRQLEVALQALRECKGLLTSIAEQELAGYKAYLQEVDFDADRDGLVDCGWALSSQRRMEQFLGRKLRGYYIGSLDEAYMHEDIKSFLFHKGQHQGWARIAKRAVELLELPFSSLEAQICRFETKVGKVTAVPLKREPQYEMVRSVFVKRMHRETEAFASFIAPFLRQVTLEEFRDVLFDLFDALANTPTPFEYHELVGLPHDRDYGKSDFATLGTFWCLPAPGHGDRNGAAVASLRSYIRVGRISLKQSGVRVTGAQVLRVIRQRLRKSA
jgi:hypothetical protein